MRFYSVVLYILATFFVGSGANAAFNPKAPSFQCQLVGHHKGLSKGMCSGTYISKTLFVTAAHCFDILETGPQNDPEKYFTIKCPAQRPKKVLAVAVHPYYFTTSPFEFGPGLVGVIDPSGGQVSTVAYNDIALLTTEPSELTKFAMLPEQDEADYIAGSCRILGFSEQYCSADGSGCYRENFSLERRNDKKVSFFCDLNTGAGCYLHSDFNEKTTSRNPLMLESTSSGMKYSQTGKGDSGGGMLCPTSKGVEVLAGVHVRMTPPNTVNVVNKLGFIKYFANLSAEEAIAKSLTFTMPADLRETLHLRESINQKLNPDGEFKLMLGTSGKQYVQILRELDKWLAENPAQNRDFLRAKSIALISPSAETEETWGWGFWKSNANLRDGFMGKILVFNRHATWAEILKLLRSGN